MSATTTRISGLGRRARSRRGLIVGGAVALLAVLVVAAALGGRERSASGPAAYDGAGAVSSGAPAASAELEAAPAAGTAAIADGAVAGGGVADRLALGQRIAQTYELRVRVARGQVPELAARAERLVAEAGGYVVTSEVTGDRGGVPDRASLTVRVPQARVGTTLDRLRGLGAVMEERVTSDDLTQDFVDASARLRHAEGVEARLVDLLARATTVQDVLRVQDRLDGVQERIEVEKGRIDALRAITDDATLTLVLREPGAAAASRGADEPWGVRAALADAAHAFVGAVNGTLVVLGAVGPFVLLALIVGGAWRWRARRRRVVPAPPAAG